MSDKPTRLSLDEILDLVSGVARDDAAGADRFRALKMLASMNSAAVVLPPPQNDEEFVERIARNMRCGTPHQSQLAYRMAFPRTRYGQDIAPRMMLGDLPEHVREKASRVTSLKILYHDCPGTKRSGHPPGYPQRGSMMAKQEWCQKAASEYFLWEEQKKLDDTPGPGAPLGD